MGERVTVQGPVKKQQPGGMSHRGVQDLRSAWIGLPSPQCNESNGTINAQMPHRAIPHPHKLQGEDV